MLTFLGFSNSKKITLALDLRYFSSCLSQTRSVSTCLSATGLLEPLVSLPPTSHAEEGGNHNQT